MSIKSPILPLIKHKQESIIFKIIQKKINMLIDTIAKDNIEEILRSSNENIQTIPNIRIDKLVQYESEIIKCNSKKMGTDIAIVTIMGLAILQLL